MRIFINFLGRWSPRRAVPACCRRGALPPRVFDSARLQSGVATVVPSSRFRHPSPAFSLQPSAFGLPRGFTLPELLVVITIIAILLGLLYSAIKTVSRYSRETITRSELVNIEAALKQYFAYYHCWPTNNIESASVITAWGYSTADGDVQYEIGPVLARTLEGRAWTNSANSADFLNADAVPFIELTRFDGSGAPINAWGSSRGQRYYVKLDLNGDGQIAVPTVVNSSASSTLTNLFRSVGVWTVNPDKNTILSSWQQ